MSNRVESITIVGDGSMATVCALLLESKGLAVTVWGPFPEHIAAAIQTRENRRYLPGYRIPESIRLTGDDAEAMAQLNRGLELSMLLTLPAAVALVVIPWPIVVVLFERGIFDRASSEATALALMAFAGGLPAYVLVKVLQPAFFAAVTCDQRNLPFRRGI